MIITIHQPEHLPWLGFFDKVRQAECLVILDHVQYRKRYFQNRNRIRSSDGFSWLTVPVLVKGRYGQALRDVVIDNEGNPRWREKCWKGIVQCYRKAPFFDHHAPFLETLYKKEWHQLLDLNLAIIDYLFSTLHIEVKTVLSSRLEPAQKKGDLILEICRKTGAQCYFSGISGGDYLPLDQFSEAGIEVRFQKFHHPIYQQMYDPFIPCLSAIDLLFNCGPNSLDILKGINVETMDQIFE